MRFVGRKTYLEDLGQLWRKRSSSLVACRGRRRIGKSTLFREFARLTAKTYIEIEGLPPEPKMTNEAQLRHFISALSNQVGAEVESAADWLTAFKRLDDRIVDGERTVVLLDEISWMGGYDPYFTGALRTAWETFFHRHDQLIVVICGSVSGWIKDNILGNTGFTGRFSRDYLLPELSLDECCEFWGEARERISPRQIIDVLSVTGGVPRYLEEINPGENADENIRRTCFSPSGELFRDFDAIFDPLFGKDVTLKKQILETLCDGPCSAADLEKKYELDRNGRVAESLKALKEGGFITDDPSVNPETGAMARVGKYRLRDNYTRFYLRYVASRKAAIEAGAFRFVSLSQLPEWTSIMGLQFENLVVNNAMSLIPHLHLGNAIVESAAPYRNMRKQGSGRKAGCQIDLLIQTPMTAYVVEIKRMREIGASVIDEVRERMRRLPLRKGMSVRPVLVYDGELDPYVEGTGFFDSIISSRALLGL